MSIAVADDFALQHAIDRAESVTRYLDARRPEQVAGSLGAVIAAGVRAGEELPAAWRLAFNTLVRTGDGSWSTVAEYEAVRNAVRRLFTTAREAMEKTRRTAEALQNGTGRRPEGLSRLLEVMEEARRLEEEVFRDWPSFAEPLPPVNLAECQPVEEAFAEMMGITVEQLQEKVAEHKRKYYPETAGRP